MLRRSWWNRWFASSPGLIWFGMTGQRVALAAAVETTGWWRLLLWLLSLFSSARMSHGDQRSLALCTSVRNNAPSANPHPRCGFQECHRAPKLCQGTMEPPFRMWHISVGAVYKHPLILCLWAGLVGVSPTPQPAALRPRATAALRSLHFYRLRLHPCQQRDYQMAE